MKNRLAIVEGEKLATNSVNIYQASKITNNQLEI